MAQEECTYTYQGSPECVLDGLETFLTQGPWRVITNDDMPLQFSRRVTFEESVPDPGRAPTAFEINCIPVAGEGWVGVMISASSSGWGLFQKAKQKETLTRKIESVHDGLSRAVQASTQAGGPKHSVWPRDPAAAQFDADWERALARFGFVTGQYPITFNLMHPKTGQPMAPHAGLGETFSHWRQIEAPYDRLCVIMDQIYQMMGSSLSRTETAHFLVTTRRPGDALTLLGATAGPETRSLDYARAMADSLLALVRPEDALSMAQKAVEAAPDDRRSQTFLADALHMTNRHEEAHAIYDRLMASLPEADTDDGVVEMFDSLFRHGPGIVPSPVLAFSVGQNLGDPEQAAVFFDLAETEFYDSPYFRMRHAYRLLGMGNRERGFAKLMSLVGEMPHLKEPSLNLMRLFEQWDPAGQTLYPEFRQTLSAEITRRGWTGQGMREFRLGPDAEEG